MFLCIFIVIKQKPDIFLCVVNKNSYLFQDHMKEEAMLDTSDILAHLSELNSYNYKYKCTIESWM
jgi:hypothetical protein